MELSFKSGKNNTQEKKQITTVGVYSPVTEAFKGDVVQKEIIFPKELGEMHPFDYTVMEGLYKKFGFSTGVVDKYIDFVVGRGFFITSDDDAAKKIISDFMEDTDFKNKLKPWLKDALLKGAGYMELGGSKNESIKGIKILNANYMYVKRDNKGNIKHFNQYIGNVGNFVMSKIQKFEEYEVAQLNLNVVGDEPYGQGIIAPNLKTINNLLGLEKDMHVLMHRKANTPIHAKVGTEDNPATTEAIKAFGTSLETLSAKHEWTTDHLVEFKLVDFGKMGEKFDSSFEYDLNMLIAGFQVPEFLLGRGNIAEGLATNQMEAFYLRASAIQEEIEKIIEQKIFKRVLLSNKIQTHVEIEWGQPSDAEVNAKILRITELLKIQVLSFELKVQLEMQLARLMEIPEATIKDIEQQKEKELNTPQPQVPGQNRQSSTPITFTQEYAKISKDDIDSLLKDNSWDYKIEGNNFILKHSEPNHVHSESCNHVEENMDEWNDKSVKEWLDFDYTQYIAFIVQAVNEDNFSLLAATSKAQEKLGMLSAKEIDKLREVLKEGFMNNHTLIDISNNINSKVKPKDLLNSDGKLIKSGSERSMIIARTETVRLAAEGSEKTYAAGGIKQYAWVASLGKRTCPICENLNGKVFEIGTAAPKPPAHTSCRCSISAVTG